MFLALFELRGPLYLVRFSGQILVKYSPQKAEPVHFFAHAQQGQTARLGGRMDKCIFISYKRANITTPIAEAFYRKVKVNLEGIGFKNTFFDRKSIEAGDQWSKAIDDALDRTTHFIALLSDEYWLSEQCQRELLGAVERNESAGNPNLLFVLTEQMNPNALVIDRTQSKGSLQQKFPKIERLSEINFLGPYDDAGRLIRLNSSDPNVLGDQIFRLIETIQKQP